MQFLSCKELHIHLSLERYKVLTKILFKMISPNSNALLLKTVIALLGNKETKNVIILYSISTKFSADASSSWQ